MRDSRDILPLHVVRMELSPCRFPFGAFRASGFLGQDSGVLKRDAVTQVYFLSRLVSVDD
jgi:hypothetical protein